MDRRIRLAAVLLALMAGGCAALPPDAGREDVSALVNARGRALPATAEAGRASLVAELTRKPLTRESAVQIALLNNPQLKAEYARLGIAAAEVYDAGRLSNPTLSAARMNSNEAGAADQITFGLTQSFTDLLLLSARKRLAEGEFARAKYSAGSAIQGIASDVESAYYSLIGAKQIAAMRTAVARAARASATLAQRFFDAGNISRLELVQEQSAASQAELERVRAEAAVKTATAKMNRLLGFGHEQAAWKVGDRLPVPLRTEDDLKPLLELAGKSRLDFAAARTEAELLASSLGMTRRYRWLGDLEIGIETERETDRSRLTGPNMSWQLPLFNQGKGAIARADAQVQQAEAELRSLQIEISNGVQLAHADVAQAKAEVNQYRTLLIPQREEIVQRTLEEVNYMLKGQFELLLAKQQEYDAYQGYLEAIRDYWLARVELAREIGTRLPSDSRIGTKTIDVQTLIKPKAAAGGGQSMPGMPATTTPAATPKPPAKATPNVGRTGMETHDPYRGGGMPSNGKAAPAPSHDSHSHSHGEHP